MASIDKLSIRGIRSFSPNHEEVIEFFHPLTVILGDNGSGKTTVIESLKIACTGSLPPGARSGQSFIHDPRIAGTNEVKASIKLRFRNRAGKPMVVQRTFQLQQQKKGAKFKALDGAIRVKNELGENVSMSHKCAELDRHIPEMLGVSKAILESVIFCHQEESNWPLLEGAVLKKRFDDIFESARYTKALDAIRKLKKARSDSAKDFHRDLTVLNVKLKAAQEISEKIEAAEEKLTATAEEASRLDSNIEQAEETLGELNQLLGEVKAEHDRLERFQSDVVQKELIIQAAYQRIEKMMSDPDDALETMLTNYDAIIVDQYRAFKLLEDEKSQLQSEVTAAQNTYTDLRTEKGVIEAKIEDQQHRVTELVELANKTGTKYQFNTLPLSSQADGIKSFFFKFERYVGEKVKTLEQVEALNRQGDDLLNSQLSELKSKLHHTAEQLKAKQRERGSLNLDKRKNAAAVKELNSKAIPSTHDISEAESSVDNAQKALQAFNDRYTFSSLTSEIVEVNRRISKIDFEIRQDNEVVKVLRGKEREHIAVEAKRQAIREKEEGFQDKLAELAIEYRALLDDETPKDEASFLAAVDHLDMALTARKADLEKREEDGRIADQKLQENQSSSKNIEKDLAAFRLEKNKLERGPVGELKRYVKEISPRDELENAEEVVQKAEKAYFAAKDKTLRCKNTITFLSIFKEKGIKDKCCPLCVRDLSPEEEVVFVKVINEKTDDNKVKDKIKKAEVAEEAALRKWKSAENALPSWRNWKQLQVLINEKSNELDSLYASQRGLQADSKDKKAQIERAQLQVNKAEEAHRAFCALQAVIHELDSLRVKLAADEERLRSAEIDVLGANAPSLADAQDSLEEKQAKLREYNRQIQSKQSELQSMQARQQQLQNDLHKRKEEKLRLDELRREFDLAIEEQGKLRDREKSLVDEISALETSHPDIQREIDAKNRELQSYRDDASARLQHAREEEQDCKQDFQSLQEKWRIVDAQTSQNLSSKVTRLGEQIAQIKQNQITAKQTMDDLSPQIAAASESLANQESLKRQIRDNLEYRTLKKDLEKLRAEVDETKYKVSALPSIDEVSRRVRTANATLNSAKEERATLRGRQHQLELQIREEKIKLKSSEYRNIEEKHRQKLIQYETTLMAVADLDKYYKALDQSLLQFHSRKVEEINTIVKSLWQITYKGQDIDTIEVISGQELDTGGTKAARSYDYRVVMKKGGALIDMRGRCSAGQKVLAALVIRLALAETFCLNCGILALDEPTTNLDTENKLGLAQAITDILNARSAQHNFQLVCITHDEEFVKMLSEAQAMDGACPEFYWRVSREDIGNNRFCSKIERREWRDGI